MTPIEETARAKCLKENGIWGGIWENAWSPETLDAAHAVKTPEGYLRTEGFTSSPSVRFVYFIPWTFVSKGGHDVPIVNTEQYQGAA